MVRKNGHTDCSFTVHEALPNLLHQVQLSVWLKDNPKDDSPVDTTELSSTPPPFQDFMDKFDAWGSAISKVQQMKDSLQKDDESAASKMQLLTSSLKKETAS